MKEKKVETAIRDELLIAKSGPSRKIIAKISVHPNETFHTTEGRRSHLGYG